MSLPQNAFTDMELGKVREVFDRVDQNGDGEISAEEIKDVFSQAGYDLPDDTAQVSPTGRG